eukprot:COSAG02_NODE_1933_length_10319_cov_22.624168_12_plen_162_part_00
MWFPKKGANDTIDKIADTRSDVAVQLLLFNQTMTSFKTAITLLRDMQQLIGNVERITEMLETLDRVAETKEDEKQSSTVTADMIEFDNVTVITPADVLLVESLSFRLENGQSLLLVGHNGSGKSVRCCFADCYCRLCILQPDVSGRASNTMLPQLLALVLL